LAWSIKLYDPTELLRLIENIDYYEHDHQEVLDKVHSYLTGNPEPLKKLAKDKDPKGVSNGMS
jgi:hypothetical protein